jgi:hypothetical protein
MLVLPWMTNIPYLSMMTLLNKLNMNMRAKEFINKIKQQRGQLSAVGSAREEPKSDEAVEKIKELTKIDK